MFYSALGYLISAWLVVGLLANAVAAEIGRPRLAWMPAWLSVGMAAIFSLTAIGL